MKKILKMLNSLAMLSVLNTTLTACQWSEVDAPGTNRIDKMRNQIAELEEQKKTASDDEIVLINKKINEIVAEWVSFDISAINTFNFKVVVKIETTQEVILKQEVPKCFSEHFSSHIDLKDRFDVEKLHIDESYMHYFGESVGYQIQFDYDDFFGPVNKPMRWPAYIKIIWVLKKS